MKERCLEQNEQYTLSALIEPEQNDSFSVQLVTITGEYPMPEFDGHRVLCAVEGDVKLCWSDHSILLIQGHAALIPAACKGVRVVGEGKLTIGIPTINEEVGK